VTVAFLDRENPVEEEPGSSGLFSFGSAPNLGRSVMTRRGYGPEEITNHLELGRGEAGTDIAE
jgi:hypothetical protein